MMVMRVDVTAQVAPELQRRMKTAIWQLLPKETDGAQHKTCLFSYRYDSFKADRVQTLRAYWSICSKACQMCSPYRNSMSPAINLETDLHVQSVTMTGHTYRDVILEQHVRLFRGAMGAEFLFMDDNTRPHRANIVDECLQSEDITRMDWAAYSPDLNPI
ncbi:transposable element Tcb2 transposase [Trichonephila clavipes]|nr:transposable element Tcb2 transposase [Trichonephila clavipes]